MKKQAVIFITGASSGFGKTSAVLLAAEGHIVYGTSRKCTEDKDGIHMLQMDVTDLASVRQAIQYVLAQQGRIDVLINNAGVGICGALELATPEEIQWQMDTNFLGVVHTCSAILPVMRKAGGGKIINISSLGGIIAVPFQGLYAASKFAVEGYSEALALEVYPFGIQVCLVEPGDFQTNFTANRNISHATSNHPAYQDRFIRTLHIIENAEKNGTNPDKLGRKICKLVYASRMPLRCKIGPVEQVWFCRFKGWLPDWLVQFVVRTFYKIG